MRDFRCEFLWAKPYHSLNSGLEFRQSTQLFTMQVFCLTIVDCHYNGETSEFSSPGTKWRRREKRMWKATTYAMKDEPAANQLYWPSSYSSNTYFPSMFKLISSPQWMDITQIRGIIILQSTINYQLLLFSCMLLCVWWWRRSVALTRNEAKHRDWLSLPVENVESLRMRTPEVRSTSLYLSRRTLCKNNKSMSSHHICP